MEKKALALLFTLFLLTLLLFTPAANSTPWFMGTSLDYNQPFFDTTGNEKYDSAFGTTLYMGLPINPTFLFILDAQLSEDYSYSDNWSSSFDCITGGYYLDGAMKMYSASMNLKYLSPCGFFLTAGIGYGSYSFTGSGEITIDSSIMDFRYPVSIEESESDIVINYGGGIQVPLTDCWSVFTQIRYFKGLEDLDGKAFLNTSLGVQYGF